MELKQFEVFATGKGYTLKRTLSRKVWFNAMTLNGNWSVAQHKLTLCSLLKLLRVDDEKSEAFHFESFCEWIDAASFMPGFYIFIWITCLLHVNARRKEQSNELNHSAFVSRLEAFNFYTMDTKGFSNAYLLFSVRRMLPMEIFARVERRWSAPLRVFLIKKGFMGEVIASGWSE